MYAFSDCRGLTSITIPNSVTSIGWSAFSGCSGLTSITIPNSVTSIGEYAFEDCSGLTFVTIGNGLTSISYGLFEDCSDLYTIYLGKSIKEIEEYAFSGCIGLRHIYCFAERVPDVKSSYYSFKDVSRKAYLWVPANRVLDYQIHEVWGEFDVQAMEAENANTGQVVVKPDNNTADIMWPAHDAAETYELTIKDRRGNEICTLVFNAQGTLTTIAFRAPAADGNYAPKAATSAGFSFTVIGLDPGTQYDYSIVVKDIADNIIENYAGSFTTKGGETGLSNEQQTNGGTASPRKVLCDGQVVIMMPNGEIFDIAGKRID